MKPDVLIFKTLLVILLFSSICVNAQSFTKENSITKVFGVNTETEIEISNKYGNINIENWDNDSVKFVINYKVTSNKESKLIKNFESINFDFNANEYYIVAKTIFSGKGSFWSDVSDIAGNLFAAGTYTSINYTIYIPKSQALNLNSKYGNIYFADYAGRLKINISNGDLKAHNLIGNTSMEIAFGDVTINKTTNANIKIAYSTLSIEEATNLTVSGQSSEIEIYNANHLSLDSKRDKIWIENATKIIGETYFTKTTVHNISNKLELITKYGSLKLKNIKHNTENVNLICTNTSVNINLHINDSYLIDISSDEKADITYASKLGDFITSETPEEEFVYNARKKYGNDKTPTNIDIKIKSGLLAIKLN